MKKINRREVSMDVRNKYRIVDYTIIIDFYKKYTEC